MKLVHLDKTKVKVEDKDKESAADLSEEGKLLEKTIQSNPGNDKALNRLMVIYRKLKEPKKELKVINTAIKTFEERFKKRQPVYNKKITTLSKALLKATGLADKKGNNLYEPGDLSKWRKRKALLLKRKKGK